MATRCRVLVADDNHDAADSLVDLLRAMGHIAFATYDGQEAVEMCADWHPDLAILDIQMPKIDGCAAARIMRSSSQPPRLIASSSGLTLDDEPLRSGVDLFDVKLAKPPLTTEIESLVSRASATPS